MPTEDAKLLHLTFGHIGRSNRFRFLFGAVRREVQSYHPERDPHQATAMSLTRCGFERPLLSYFDVFQSQIQCCSCCTCRGVMRVQPKVGAQYNLPFAKLCKISCPFCSYIRQNFLFQLSLIRSRIPCQIALAIKPYLPKNKSTFSTLPQLLVVASNKNFKMDQNSNGRLKRKA